jgi:tetratricopeptide (TPR) repeat protein
MSKQTLAEAGEAFRQGNMAEVAELLDAGMIDVAESPEAADRLRFVRAYALVQSGNPQAALIMIAGIDPARQASRATLKLAAVAAISANDLDRARAVLAQLVKSGDRDAIETYQAVLVRRGLDALAARDFATAIETLRAAHIQHLKDVATKFAAWLGLLAASEGANDRAGLAQTFALFPEWAQDRRANLIAARSAIAALDRAPAVWHLEALGPHADAWPLWWVLCRDLFAARRFKDVVELFGVERANMPDAHAKSIATVVAVSLFASGHLDDAQQEIEKLTARFADDELVAHVAAFLANANGDFQRAETHLRRVTDEKSEPVMLLRWALLFGREKYEPIRDALNPEAVRAWPEGPERDAAALIASLANALLGSTGRAWALLRTAGDIGKTQNETIRYLGGYLALVERDYTQAAELLGRSPLGALARIETARDMADAGAHAGAAAELEQALGRGLDPTVVETRNLIRLQLAQDAVRADDLARASALFAQVRAEAPHLADRVAGLEDYVAVRNTLRSVKDADPARVADVIWSLYETTPPETTEALASARRRDLAYLSGVMRVRFLEQRKRDAPAPLAASVVQSIVAALEASLDEDPDFAPAAALLGIVLTHSGVRQRALDLLDLANQAGLSTPSIKAALAIEYLHDGRLVEAKRIFVDQLAVRFDDVAAHGRLGDIFARESMFLLHAPRRASAPSALPKTALEAPDLPTALDPFAGIDPKSRILALLHRVESRAAASAADASAKLAEIARELKRMSVQGVSPAFGELEQRALVLLDGGGR